MYVEIGVVLSLQIWLSHSIRNRCGWASLENSLYEPCSLLAG